jgi:hypothetical protein
MDVTTPKHTTAARLKMMIQKKIHTFQQWQALPQQQHISLLSPWMDKRTHLHSCYTSSAAQEYFY